MRMSARVDGVASRVQSAIQMRQVSPATKRGLKHLYLFLVVLLVGDVCNGRSCEVYGRSIEVHEPGKGM